MDRKNNNKYGLLAKKAGEGTKKERAEAGVQGGEDANGHLVRFHSHLDALHCDRLLGGVLSILDPRCALHHLLLPLLCELHDKPSAVRSLQRPLPNDLPPDIEVQPVQETFHFTESSTWRSTVQARIPEKNIRESMMINGNKECWEDYCESLKEFIYLIFSHKYFPFAASFRMLSNLLFYTFLLLTLLFTSSEFSSKNESEALGEPVNHPNCEFSLQRIPGLNPLTRTDSNGKSCRGDVLLPFCRGWCKSKEVIANNFS